jgi:hypothetical protein
MAPSTDEKDALAAQLRSLPAHAPDAKLDAAVLLQARDALAGHADFADEPGWLGRFAVPALLSAATVSYLWWAVSAASALYL